MPRFEVGKTYRISLGFHGSAYITVTARSKTHIKFTGDYSGVRRVFQSKSKYTGEVAYIDLSEIHTKAIVFAGHQA